MGLEPATTGITMLSITKRDESFATSNARRVRVFFWLVLVLNLGKLPTDCLQGKPKPQSKKPRTTDLVATGLVPIRLVNGSSTWARTRDLRINSPALYQLSYRGIQPEIIAFYLLPTCAQPFHYQTLNEKAATHFALA